MSYRFCCANISDFVEFQLPLSSTDDRARDGRGAALVRVDLFPEVSRAKQRSFLEKRAVFFSFILSRDGVRSVSRKRIIIIIITVIVMGEKNKKPTAEIKKYVFPAFVLRTFTTLGARPFISKSCCFRNRI